MEKWKPINGYENYEVSNLGRIRKVNTGFAYKSVYAKGKPYKWRAYIDTEHGREGLGTFETEAEAKAAHDKAMEAFPDHKVYKIIKLQPGDVNGHIAVTLYGKNSREKAYVHRLVAAAFIGDGHEGDVVNHKDFNPANNCVENLEWCTQRENVRYSSHKMRHPKSVGRDMKHIRLRKNGYEVCVRSVNGRYCGTFKTLDEAKEFRDEAVRKLWAS